MQGLNAGKHVLVEKPITLDSLEAIQLIHTAEKHNLQLMVDHTFVYSPPVQYLYESITKHGLGSLHAFDSTRINLGLIQKDTNVIWDLAVHDISIVNYITGRLPVSVSATGAHIPQSDQHVTGYMSLFYDDGFIAHINVSWFSPVKIRRTIVTGQNKMIVYDDLETSEKIKVYDSGVDVKDDPESIQKLLVSYRVGDIMSPLIPQGEALLLMVETFAKSILVNNPSPTSGLFGLQVVQIVEATIRSLHSNGSNMLMEYSL
jgi:predicted dehydrogenase